MRHRSTVLGGMDSPAARHTAEYLAESLGYVLAKTGPAPRGPHHRASGAGGQRAVRVQVDANGPGPASDRTTSGPDRAGWCMTGGVLRLAGGRCGSRAGHGQVDGDQALGRRVIDALATTP